MVRRCAQRMALVLLVAAIGFCMADAYSVESGCGAGGCGLEAEMSCDTCLHAIKELPHVSGEYENEYQKPERVSHSLLWNVAIVLVVVLA
ncbi:MAG: hypothetical protein K2H14_00650 [Muribaculaceae bacterium]|nr:hypothetical protein [Muribaculaceae bacterium]